MVRSIAVTLGVSLVLALVLANLGAGMPFGLTFAVIMLVAAPLLVGYTGVGKRGWIITGVVWLIAVYALMPAMQAAYHAKQPLTYKGLAMAMITRDIKQAIEITPVDTGIQAQVLELREKLAAAQARELQQAIQRVQEKIGSVRMYDDYGAMTQEGIELETQYQSLLETAGRLNRNMDQNIRIDTADSSVDSAGFDLSGISELPGVMPYLMLIVGFGVVVSLGYGISTGEKSHYGRAAGWLAFGAVLYIGSIMYMDRNPYAGQVIYSSPASSGQDGQGRKFVAGDSMPMYESRWINTGIRITEPVRIEVTGNGLHNQGMPSCGSNGCATPQISGPRVADGANHMAVIGRVGNGNLFMVGTGAVVDPAEFGTGELFITVNQVTNNDLVWSNMTGGFYIRAATLSAANTAN